jgi:hypothetical protein
MEDMKIDRRAFGKLLAGVPALSALERSVFEKSAFPVSSAGESESRPWYETNSRWTGFNLHMPDWDPAIASRLNAKEIIRNVLKSNSNFFWLYAVDGAGNAYYPTKVGRMHLNLAGRDIVREVVDECKRNQIPFLLNYCLGWNRYAALSHAEWTMKDNHNETVTGEYGPVLGPYLCWNSGYLDYVKAMTTEMLDYDPDGLYFDMLFYGSRTVCYCQEHCQPLFRKKYGIEMPLTPTWDDAWRKFLEFRYDSLSHFAQEVTEHARKLRPRVSVAYNCRQKPVQHSQLSDYVTAEPLPALRGAWDPSRLTTFLRGLKPASRVLMSTSRGAHGYSDYTLRPEADLKWEVFTYLAHGARAFPADDALYDGSLQPQFYELMGRIFGEAKRKEPYFGQEHVREVGLYYSVKSRDWYGRGQGERYDNAFAGAHRALAELHIPVDALFDESVTLKQLQAYPIVYLPNVAILDKEEAQFLREYVKNGGQLLATHDTGLCDLDGKRREDFVLADVLGVRYKGQAEYTGHYYRLPEGFLSAGMWRDWDVFVSGTANLVESSGAEAVGELKIPFYDGPPFHRVNIGQHNSAWKTVAPAVFLNRYGQGQTAYVPFGPDTAYVGEYPLPEHRILLRNILRHLYPNPEVSVEAPLVVEAVITQDTEQSRYIVHLVSCQGGREMNGVTVPVRPNVMEEPLIYRARIQLQRTARQVTSLSDKTKITQHEKSIALQIEDIHEAVIISY